MGELQTSIKRNTVAIFFSKGHHDYIARLLDADASNCLVCFISADKLKF
jgi:hypothetical protein